MTHQIVSATTLVRNFSDFLNRVRYQGATFDVTRGSEVIACISPPRTVEGFPIDKLNALFAALPPLTDGDAAQFEADVAAVIDNLPPERNPWEC